MSTNKPVLQHTNKYDMFEENEFNRPLHSDPILLRSMSKHGFLASHPLQCIRNGNGKLKIVCGHNRFAFAKRLGIPVYYVVDEKTTDLMDLEGSNGSRWSVSDHVHSQASMGDKNCQALLKYMDDHKLPMSVASSLVAGETCCMASNQTKHIKAGHYRVGDMKHANRVADITDFCRSIGIGFATTAAFTRAISMCLLVPRFDKNVFLHKVETNKGLLMPRSRWQDCLDEIEAMYNHGTAQRNRIPLAFEAKCESAKLSASTKKH